MRSEDRAASREFFQRLRPRNTRGSLPDLNQVRLARPPRGPLRAISQRLLIALGMLLLITLVVYLDRDGYRDVVDGRVGLLDSLYYATVSLSTTGYGDIVPASDRARLLNVLIITPARVLFLIVLVGTTLEVLTERSREAFSIMRWQNRLEGHVIVCGYGTKGRTATRTLRRQGVDPRSIVVIDPDPKAVREANAEGFTGVIDTATRADVLRQVHVERARAVVVAVDRDDAAVLITLTARELAPKATITAAVRESENVHLLRQSGANSVILSSEAAGRLLGMSTNGSRVVQVIEDLLSAGEGLELVERSVRTDDLDGVPVPRAGEVVIAVVRGGVVLGPGVSQAGRLQPDDRIICVHSAEELPEAPAT